MKKFFRNPFLKLRKYFFYENEYILILIPLFVGLFLVLLANLEIKKIVSPKPSYGGIYREAFYEDMSSFDPFNPKNDNQRALVNILYPPLIEFDNGKLISKFIKSYSISSDKLTYTFVLKDLKWSNGDELTSEDIFFSFKSFKKLGSPEIISLFKDVEIEVIDKKTFSFHLKNNDNYFFFNLKYIRPLPEKIFNSFLSNRENFNEFPKDLLKVGAGPFVLENWQEGKDLSLIILKRNDYYPFRPYLEKIIFNIYSSPKRAFDALLLKEVDGLSGLNYFNLPTNIFNHFNIYKMTLPRVIGIFLNNKKINSKDFTFLEKVDRNELNKIVFNFYAEETNNLFSPTVRKILNLYDFNNQEFENSQKDYQLTLLVPSLYFYPDIARYLRDKFNLKVELVDNETFNEKLKNKEYEAILMGINYDYPPVPFYFWSQAGLNLNNSENLELEKSFQKLISDPEFEFYPFCQKDCFSIEELIKIEKEIKNTKSNIFLINPFYLFFLDKDIVGFDQNFLFAPEARFVKIEYWYKRK